MAIKLTKGLFISCSCSYFVTKEEWYQALIQAASIQGKQLIVLEEYCFSKDHPLALSHPETGYLKAALFYIESNR